MPARLFNKPSSHGLEPFVIPKIMLRAGFEIPRLGFGVSGPHGAPLTPESLTARLIGQCLDSGLNLFDTAPFYGEAEARLGRAIGARARDSFLLISKAGKRRQNGRLVADFSPKAMQSQAENSLKTLGVSTLDILLLHGPPANLGDESRKAFLNFKASGLTRALGICGRGEEIAAFADDIDVIMAPCASSWPRFAAARGIGFIGIESMAAAARWSFPPTPGDVWRLARRLRSGNGARDARSPPAALASALTLPDIGSVVFTTTSPTHLAECLQIATLAG